MNFLPIILATILGFATAIPADSVGIKDRIFNGAVTRNEKALAIKEILETSGVTIRNSIVENLLNNVIDMLRDLIQYGSGDIPVLDPFELETLHLTGDMVDIIDLPNSHITLNDLTVKNLGTFEIDQLKVSTVSIILQRYRILLDARIPTVDVNTGNYDLSINVFGGHIFGNGEMTLQLVNPRIYSNIVVGLRLSISGIFLEVRELNLRVGLDSFKAQITGLFGNEVASDFVSSLISSLVPELLEFFEDDITNTLSTAVQEIANDLLNDLNLIDLLG